LDEKNKLSKAVRNLEITKNLDQEKILKYENEIEQLNELNLNLDKAKKDDNKFKEVKKEFKDYRNATRKKRAELLATINIYRN
jgi:hypothetical protein